ncbi:hypothetical protein EVAR_97785_1 [Eumeta japonica]|uniref:Uncharacterized protein n=1 Tax=Eumeta variegata TaxID=151549 RepID=A0A4C1XC63_EUMVA|nr:hypothetical protein EVAR_97785_1 [Eumeta japonica]
MLRRSDPLDPKRIYRVARILAHPDYRTPKGLNDIGLLESHTQHALKIVTSKSTRRREKHLTALLLIPSRPSAFLLLRDLISVPISLRETEDRSSLDSRKALRRTSSSMRHFAISTSYRGTELSDHLRGGKGMYSPDLSVLVTYQNAWFVAVISSMRSLQFSFQTSWRRTINRCWRARALNLYSTIGYALFALNSSRTLSRNFQQSEDAETSRALFPTTVLTWLARVPMAESISS